MSQQSTLSSGTCASGAQFRHLWLCLREGLVKLRGLFGLLQLFSSRHHRLSVLNVLPGPKPLPHPVSFYLFRHELNYVQDEAVAWAHAVRTAFCVALLSIPSGFA